MFFFFLGFREVLAFLHLRSDFLSGMLRVNARKVAGKCLGNMQGILGEGDYSDNARGAGNTAGILGANRGEESNRLAAPLTYAFWPAKEYGEV